VFAALAQAKALIADGGKASATWSGNRPRTLCRRQPTRAGMILPWIRRRGSGPARRAAARFRRSVAEALTAGTRALRAHRYDPEVPR